MSYILNGTIHTTINKEIIVKYLGKEYRIDDTTSLDFVEGSTIEFSLEKKIFSDKTEIVAKVRRTKNWDEIYKKYIEKNCNFTISNFQEFLKNNYQVPELLKK